MDYATIVDKKLLEKVQFRNRVAKSAWFDVEHLMKKKPPSFLLRIINGDYSTEIVLYAKMGIHMYNMIQGKNLQLNCIEKYNDLPRVAYSAYYITLVAKDPALVGFLVPFQTQVVEEGFDKKSLTCYIARPKFGPQEKPVVQPLNQEPEDYYRDIRLPDWPSDQNAFADKNRFYVMKKSELRKYDWIRLYMELAFLRADDTKLKNPNLSKLAFVEVAVETEENAEPLMANSATFYIRYKYQPKKGGAGKVHGRKPMGGRTMARNATLYASYKYHMNTGGAGKFHGRKLPRDRIAIVRRTMDKNKQLLTLMFDNCTVKNASIKHYRKM